MLFIDLKYRVLYYNLLELLLVYTAISLVSVCFGTVDVHDDQLIYGLPIFNPNCRGRIVTFVAAVAMGDDEGPCFPYHFHGPAEELSQPRGEPRPSCSTRLMQHLVTPSGRKVPMPPPCPPPKHLLSEVQPPKNIDFSNDTEVSSIPRAFQRKGPAYDVPPPPPPQSRIPRAFQPKPPRVVPARRTPRVPKVVTPPVSSSKALAVACSKSKPLKPQEPLEHEEEEEEEEVVLEDLEGLDLDGEEVEVEVEVEEEMEEEEVDEEYDFMNFLNQDPPCQRQNEGASNENMYMEQQVKRPKVDPTQAVLEPVMCKVEDNDSSSPGHLEGFAGPVDETKSYPLGALRKGKGQGQGGMGSGRGQATWIIKGLQTSAIFQAVFSGARWYQGIPCDAILKLSEMRDCIRRRSGKKKSRGESLHSANRFHFISFHI